MKRISCRLCSYLLLGLLAGCLSIFSCQKDREAGTTKSKWQQDKSVEQQKKQPAIAAGSLVAKRTAYEMAVYHPGQPEEDPVVTAKKLIKTKNLQLNYVPKFDDQSKLPAVTIKLVDIKEYRVPPPEMLPYISRGLDESDKKRLLAAKQATILRFFGTGKDARQTLRQAYQLVGEFARASKGLAWDEETRLCYTPQGWQSMLLDNWDKPAFLVLRHIFIHAYQEGDLIRAISLGMAKFGLPDIVIEDIPRSYSSSMGDLINLVAQVLYINPNISRTGKLDISGQTLDQVLNIGAQPNDQPKPKPSNDVSLDLVQGIRDKGDPDNRLIEIIFPGKQESLFERQSSLLDQIFGTDRDAVTHVEHDAELETAKKAARKILLGKLKQKFIKGLAPGERLLVKAPFTTPDQGVEWMWLEAVKWQDKKVYGILMNDPHYIPNLKSGARVEAADKDLFDYILIGPDGSRQGNETGKIMQRRHSVK
jgi:uncharacterized protein YegJ (DUF2314 family)